MTNQKVLSILQFDFRSGLTPIQYKVAVVAILIIGSFGFTQYQNHKVNTQVTNALTEAREKRKEQVDKVMRSFDNVEKLFESSSEALKDIDL